MNKYKVMMTLTRTYCVDVLADNEDQARHDGEVKFFEAINSGTEHYFETDDSIHHTTVYDVTNTNDPFNP